MNDTFVRDHLPPPELWPTLDFDGLPELSAYPERLECASALLDGARENGHGTRNVLHFGDIKWTYDELAERVDRIARVLVEDLGLETGNRVLLRAPNNPMAVACWLAIARAGGVVVATMPMLRTKELAYIIDKARITFALCDRRLDEDLAPLCADDGPLEHCLYFRGDVFTPAGAAPDTLEQAMAGKDGAFEAADTAADDPVLIAFTSGTTGQPKGTVHFHRDILAICDTFAKHVLHVQPDDVFVGSPPLAFTFGLGALVTFPMRFGASTVLVERFGPTTMLETVQRYGVTGMYTSPTGYRAMSAHTDQFDLSTLRHCVSAGEHLPEATWRLWHDKTGIRIVDGIGATEMLHIFISAAGDAIKPGCTGKALPGFRARVVDDEMRDVPDGTPGRLAVQGPTGCRYLDDEERQRRYVRDGWNLTGDVYLRDSDGYFRYVARADDMIVSSGYNIAGPEVEGCLLHHDAVAECAVVGAPDDERGQIVKAFVVLADGHSPGPETTKALQDFAKAHIAPYKYPRALEYVDKLPRTQTGKLQRFRLRDDTTPGDRHSAADDHAPGRGTQA